MPPAARGLRPARLAALALVSALLAATPSAAGVARAVVLDGVFNDWRNLSPAATDAAGDGAAGALDLGRLWLANDADALYLHLEVGRETLLQNGPLETLGNSLRLLLDLDRNPATGRPAEGLGAEIEVRFGEREVTSYDTGGNGGIQGLGGAFILVLPTHSAGRFEIRVPYALARSAALAAELAAGREIELVLVEEAVGGDRLPDAGSLVYETSSDPVREPRPIRLGKRRSKHVRLLTHNVERSNIEVEPEAFARILAAVEPDIIAYQEVTGWNAEQTREFVAEALPLESGRWHAAQVNDTVTVSRFPILASSFVDANLVTLIDLPQRVTARDLVLFNAHTPCCDNDAGRDDEHDHLMATWRDLLEGRGPFSIGDGDAVVLAGDFNMVGYSRQLKVLLEGTFIDPANGPDFRPGRGKGKLRSAKLRHSHGRTVHTWRRSSSAFGPGKLDYVIWSPDAARLRRNYVLETESLPVALLESLGLEPTDTSVASDHLPLVTDFNFKRSRPARP